MTDHAPATTSTSAGTGTSAGSGTVVRIPGPLRDHAGGAAEVVVAGETVAAVLDALLARHPGLRRHLRTEAGALRDYVNVFVNEDDIRYLDGVDTGVGPEDAITIVPSIAGG